LQIWDSRIVKKPLTEIPCSSRVNRLCFSPSGIALALPADDGSLKSYNLSGELMSRIPRESCTVSSILYIRFLFLIFLQAILTSAVWSNDESVLFSSGWDLAITGWEPEQAHGAVFKDA
jgi:hypothetical protein